MQLALYVLAAILVIVFLVAFVEEAVKAVQKIRESRKARLEKRAREQRQRQRADAEHRMLLLSSEQWKREEQRREENRQRPRIEAERFYATNFELLRNRWPPEQFQTFLALEMHQALNEQALWQAYRNLLNALHPILSEERERRTSYVHQAAILQAEHERRVAAIRSLHVEDALQERLLEREGMRFRNALEALTDQEPTAS